MPEFFEINTLNSIATVIFSRPPVNAFSYEVYRELVETVNTIEQSDSKVVILTAPADSRAWVGGADLKDLIDLDYETRKARYEIINGSLPRFYNLDRPVIAAITGPTVGVGVSVASFCDIRIASPKSFFAKPEIDRGLIGGAAQLRRLNLPAGLIREMIYTARRVPAEEMARAGFVDHLVAPGDVLSKANEIAAMIAGKSLTALRANKICNNITESMDWEEGYKTAQEFSAKLTATTDAKEGIRAFLERREPKYTGQ